MKLTKTIEKLGETRSFVKGKIIFNAKDPANGFYYIQTGEIRIYKMDEEGRELEVVRLGPNDFLGEVVLFASPVFPVYAQAVRETKALFFAKSKILKIIDQDSASARFFINLLAQKCLILNKRIETLGLRTVRQRLVQYILANCTEKSGYMLELKMKKVELAKLIGTISETLSRNLKQLQDEGLIEVKGKKIIIKNCPQMKLELSS